MYLMVSELVRRCRAHADQPVQRIGHDGVLDDFRSGSVYVRGAAGEGAASFDGAEYGLMQVGGEVSGEARVEVACGPVAPTDALGPVVTLLPTWVWWTSTSYLTVRRWGWRRVAGIPR